jgi:peroxiredoxin family protein
VRALQAMGISKEELIDGIELGGVADFMAASYDSGLKLFI